MLERPVVVDIGLTIGLLVLSLAFGGLPRANITSVAAGAELAAVLVRHRWPEVTFAVGLLAALVHIMGGQQPIPADAAGLIGLYSVAADRGRRRSVAMLCVALAVVAAWDLRAYYIDRANSIVVAVHRDGTVSPVSPPHLSPAMQQQITQETADFAKRRSAPIGPGGVQVTILLDDYVPVWGGFWLGAVLLLVAWGTGTAARRRRANLVMLRERARELEHQRDTRARLAVVDERARISRELHDVVAHGLSVVVLQAQGGAAALEHHPDRTRQALEAIVVTGRHALAETRRLLGALGNEDSVSWAPQPGIGRLPELCEQVRATGLALGLEIDGDPYELPAAVDLAAYRIVQEALTNILKHAGEPTTTTVVLRYAPTALAVEVANSAGRRDGTTVPDADQGAGLRGMRERATVLGGTFHAGPDPEGGFVVRASLPLEIGS